MLQKIILALFIFILSACAKEREIEDYPNVIPPMIEQDYPDIYKIFKKKTD
jgi:hypothetical protein